MRILYVYKYVYIYSHAKRRLRILLRVASRFLFYVFCIDHRSSFSPFSLSTPSTHIDYTRLYPGYNILFPSHAPPCIIVLFSFVYYHSKRFYRFAFSSPFPSRLLSYERRENEHACRRIADPFLPSRIYSADTRRRLLRGTKERRTILRSNRFFFSIFRWKNVFLVRWSREGAGFSTRSRRRKEKRNALRRNDGRRRTWGPRERRFVASLGNNRKLLHVARESRGVFSRLLHDNRSRIKHTFCFFVSSSTSSSSSFVLGCNSVPWIL